MTPQDVHLILNGWRESRSQLTLLGELWGFALALPCRVELVTDQFVELSTPDQGLIVVSISEEGTEFKYAELRERAELADKFGLSAEQRSASSLTMLFPSRSEGDEPESLSFVERIVPRL